MKHRKLTETAGDIELLMIAHYNYIRILLTIIF